MLAGQSAAASLSGRSLNSGDVIDFVAGVNGSLGGDSTAFDATVALMPELPPALRNLTMPGGLTTLVLEFSEAVTAVAGNFQLSGGGSVLSVAAGSAPNIVVLTVTPLTRGGNYTLTMTGVADFDGQSGCSGFCINLCGR